MVLSSSFPRPLQHAFRRRKNSTINDENKMDSRKVSIDQTVSSSEDWQQVNAMSDMHHSSFDLVFVAPPERAHTDALIGDAMYNNDYSYHGRESMSLSQSDPSLSAQYTASGHSSFVDHRAQVPQHQERLTQSWQGMGRNMRSPLLPSPPPPMGLPPNYYSYGPPRPRNDKVHVERTLQVDPTLQARIEAVKIQEELLGSAHPDVIFALAGIAKLFEKRGDHAQAANIMKDIQMRSIMAKSAPQGNLNQDVPIEISFPR